MRSGGVLGSVVAAVALYVGQQEVTGEAVLWVGADGSCTRSGTPEEYDEDTSCGGLGDAYTVAQDGDTVLIAPLTYDGQQIYRAIDPPVKDVTFEGAGGYPRLGATVVDVDNVTLRHVRIENRDPTGPFVGTLGFHSNAGQVSPANLTFDDVHVDGLMNEGGQRPGIAGDGTDVTFTNGSVGNLINEKGVLIAGLRVTFDNWYFHDVIVTDPLVHNECMYALSVPHMIVRNSRFWNCPTMDMFVTYGSWWDPLGPPNTDILIENNVFSHSRHENSEGFHAYSLYIAWSDIPPVTDPYDYNVGPDLYRWTVRNNTFEVAAFLGGIRQAHDSVWANNIGGWDCMLGMEFHNNVGQVCDASDRSVSPSASSETERTPMRWVDPASNDFRLGPGSPAISAGGAAYATSEDIRGVARGNPPDAGAYEYP